MQDIMGVNDIAFPNLGLYLRNIPQGFTVFGFYISLYGVIIAIGVMAGISIAAHLAKKTGQDPDDYWDFAIFGVIFGLIGARIYYVVFEWDSYKDNLLEIFNVRGGGMAIYGGVIAAFTTLFVWCKIKKRDPRQIGDTAMAGLLLGQIIGRWGNFTNREVFGEYSDGLLAMRIP
ncbi:MAG: prolipoprotein diacylglyceryl transferase, partial [Acetatifactor sp.]|nr:prolipoprotein diacylglyceryl transferase [Acetatifactor sp.]